ncbi:hypothetical protein [Streptomyces sp. NPDC088748]|uniref:hypothetical protein n=1 Tax=Streptomyces sp. NPDC088748 TaxID=3365887 RepID=UPI003823B02B
MRLAGRPGWGAWYATSELPYGSKKDEQKQGFVRSVTVYDTTGRTLATITSPSFS